MLPASESACRALSLRGNTASRSGLRSTRFGISSKPSCGTSSIATAKKLRCDIFARAKHHGTFKTIRKCIVGQILSTDMIFHKEKTDKLAAINKLDLQVNTPYLVSALSCTSA